MGKVKNKILSSVLGVSGGLAGLTFLPRCSGNTCASCYGCAGAGIVILFIAAIKKFKGGSKNNGLASGNN